MTTGDRSGRLEAMRRFVSARLDRESSLGLGLTVSILALAALVWAFGGLLEEVLDAATLVQWDLTTARWIHDHAVPAGTRAFALITTLGSEVALAVAFVVGVALLWKGQRFVFWLWLAAHSGGWILQGVLKAAIHRDRPQYAASYLHGHTYSFPSGHTLTATITYIALAWVIASVTSVSRERSMAMYGVAALLVAAVALSRVYLGVHYPSDVLGGVLAGMAWLALCAVVATVARRPSVSRSAEAGSAGKKSYG